MLTQEEKEMNPKVFEAASISGKRRDIGHLQGSCRSKPRLCTFMVSTGFSFNLSHNHSQFKKGK